MNFGHGITIALIAFVIFILTLVTSFLRQDVDLEYTDYYTRELVFNETKEATENGMPFLNNLQIESAEGQLNLFFDENFPQFNQAELHFYRADNAAWDLNKKIGQGRLHQFSWDEFHKGKYELRMDWKIDNEDFSIRKTFWVSK
jgi:hypothetical protein